MELNANAPCDHMSPASNIMVCGFWTDGLCCDVCGLRIRCCGDLGAVDWYWWIGGLDYSAAGVRLW